jgi:DNA-binding response OmpR family regulator
MRNERTNDASYVLIEDVRHAERRAAPRRFEATEEVVDPWSYWAKRGLSTIRLSMVEYRILRFLADRPNQALTRQRIAEAVSTESHCVTVEALNRYIHSLRGQLGFFSDYIQSVPYIGYRFKA